MKCIHVVLQCARKIDRERKKERENDNKRKTMSTYPWENLGEAYMGAADPPGMAAGSWYSVLKARSSSFCSLLWALLADLMSMKDTVAQTPVPSSSLERGNNLTLWTRPYLHKEYKLIITQNERIPVWTVIVYCKHYEIWKPQCFADKPKIYKIHKTNAVITLYTIHKLSPAPKGLG